VGFADALAALLDDPVRRQRSREAGWARAQAFEWASTAREVRAAWAKASEARRRRLG